MIARVIAHSCTETGIAKAYADLFDIKGGRLQILSFPALAGKTFGGAVRVMDGAVPVGVIAGGRVLLNPPEDRVMEKNDDLICWADDKEITFAKDTFAEMELPAGPAAPAEEKTVVIGDDPALETLLRELPEQHNLVTAAHIPEERRASLLALAEQQPDVTLTFFDGDTEDPDELKRLLSDAQHVVVLANESDDADNADMINILRYIKITDFKRREELSFSVTVELRSEKHVQLTGSDSAVDLIVAPHLVSMFLAQLAERPELAGVFRELLSNEGSELHLKPAALLGEGKTVTCGALRAALLRRRMLLLGYMEGDATVLNPALNDTVSTDEIDKLVVISET